MSDIIIRGGDLLPPGLSSPKAPEEGQVKDKAFSSVLKGAIEDINKLQNNADQAIAKLEVDNTTSIHEAVIALEKADVSFRAMMQVRNKIIDAYQEVMRMPV